MMVQNCLGRSSPAIILVSGSSLLPSPPARITPQRWLFLFGNSSPGRVEPDCDVMLSPCVKGSLNRVSSVFETHARSLVTFANAPRDDRENFDHRRADHPEGEYYLYPAHRSAPWRPTVF